MKIFIGSSAEQKAYLDLIASWIESSGHEPVLWNDSNVFPPGSYILSSLVKIAKTVEAAVFIFSEDDTLWYRKAKIKQPRDNVIFEYGVFLGILGKERVIFCRDGKPKPASDILGVVYIDISKGNLAKAKLIMLAWIESLELVKKH